MSVSRADAAEAWTDPRLTQTNGLIFWFDASRQNAARGQAGLTPLQSWHDRIDFLLDGSGRRHDLGQPIFDARPSYEQSTGTIIRFDGTNDFLAGTFTGMSAPEATLLWVVKPRRFAPFAAFASANRRGRNDYQTGFNVDLGAVPGQGLERISVEGAGFSGERNLLKSEAGPLERWHLLAVVVKSGPNGVRLRVDGVEQGRRDRDTGASISLDQFTLGARFYSNSAERPWAQNFLQADFTEMLAYDRALSGKELAAAENYLDTKHGALLHGLGDVAAPGGAVRLVAATNPPPVRMFVPGFTARELPVGLGNVNNVRYRPDGSLLAVGYDGRIWILRDTDGDGLEDKAEAFWDKGTLRAPIGAALTPPGYARGDGVFVAAKDKLALVLDRDRDGRADEEITVATWTERSEQQGVDALGVAVGPDGSVYFSLGAASFTEPFLVDKSTGLARYRTTMDRGTIQRVSPDFSRRETVCTGIRFAIGIAFNHEGDLFCTDQEGATWRHDGNPFDELLHIQAGRHYGFPPRHPKYLPEVIDEPSVFDYAPQHQSTCGLQFNDPVNGGPVFGPEWWKGDALVTGYSRGKLWRTKLVKAGGGYVAQTQLIATLQSLCVDACVSPRGDLIVAAHSGQPDWGSGPSGPGKLYRLRHEDRSLPQPVAAWNASPTEIKIEFDRPISLASLRNLATLASVEGGRYVFAGDRFESIRPGYQVVYDQLASPRRAFPILSAQRSGDGRQVALVTRPRVTAVNYAVTLPVLRSVEQEGKEPPKGAEESTLELLTDLTGVEASWPGADGKSVETLWLPHLETKVARELTLASAAHASGPNTPVNVTLRGKLDLFQMLQPAIQPGAQIDWVRPAETVTIAFSSSAKFQGKVGGEAVQSTASGDGSRQRAEVTLTAPGREWQAYEIRLEVGAYPLDFRVSWHTADDPRPRALPIRRLLMPWAVPADLSDEPTRAPRRDLLELAGGNPRNGRALFLGDKLACARCHTMRGEGGQVGPDLSNLTERDYASVRKDIQFPNAALNPDHIASDVRLTDGESISGIIQREEGGTLHVAQASGLVEKVPCAKVASIAPAKLSLMPEGLWEGMSAEERRDLMSFLLLEPEK